MRTGRSGLSGAPRVPAAEDSCWDETERVTARVEQIRQASEAVAVGMHTVGTTVSEMRR